MKRLARLAIDPQLPLFPPGSPGFPWPVRRSTRARRFSARVFLDGRVEIVAPARATETLLRDFVARHRAWIERRSAEAAGSSAARELAFPPPAIDLVAFGESWVLGRGAPEGKGRLRQCGPALLELSGAPAGREGTRGLLLAWLVERSRVHLAATLDELAAAHGYAYERLELRRQRTRWGSCSTRGTISLNVCIAFQRPEVMRYLLLHELAHTHHMNHSRAFWARVEATCPDWRALDRELMRGWERVPGWVFR